MPAAFSFLCRTRHAFLALLLTLVASAGWAQTCGPNATPVTFNFGTVASQNASGGTATWTRSSLGPTAKPLGLASAGTANTLTFAMDKSPNAVWTDDGGGTANPSPMQLQVGNMPDSLLFAMDNPAAGNWTGMTVTMARPMSTVSFVMGDVDTSNNNFQDRFEVTGYLSGIAVTAPVMVPVTPANYTTTTVAGFTAQITRTYGSGGCNNNTNACNVTVNFSQPIDSFRIRFISGPDTVPNGQPTLQYVGFDDFSFCVPSKPDLKLTKAATTTTFVAGQTGTYTFAVTNVGGTPTTGNYTVTDVISTAGVTFPTPLTPGGGWTCTVSATNFASDTASCTRATTLASNGSTTLTLTVVITSNNAATTVTNRAKAFGGNDPNKSNLNSTGPIANCSAANEGLSGGGANAGCAFEETTLVRQANLTAAKDNGATSVIAGSTTAYTLTFANLGPSAADNTTVKDTTTVGLNCAAAPATVTCATVTGGASCPNGLVLNSVTNSAAVPNFFNATGLPIPTFPPGGSVQLRLICQVTATGT